MTWVLGKPYVQGFALIIADICVSYRDSSTGSKKYLDCLLKVHDISKEDGLIVGFAGDVEHAFEIIDKMRLVAKNYKLQNQGKQLEILEFIGLWREYAKIYKQYQYPDDAKNGVHMILAGTTLSKNDKGEAVPFSRAFEIKSPTYRPMGVHPFLWHQIGSGSGLDLCKNICDELSRDFRFKLVAINSTPEELIQYFVPNISALLERDLKDEGISSSLTIGISSHGDFGLATTYSIGDDGKGKPIKLATTYEELLAITKSSKASAHSFRAELPPASWV